MEAEKLVLPRLVVCAYRGHSWVSKTIRFQTRSRWSHIALGWWCCGDLLQFGQFGRVIEAWHKGGKKSLFGLWDHGKVRETAGLWEDHEPGTQVDLFAVRNRCEVLDRSAWEFAVSQIGKGYDFRSVFQFCSRREPSRNRKWFCSELAFSALQHGGYDVLERIPAAMVSPQMLVVSPVFGYVGSVREKDGGVEDAFDLELL
jgi:hypothetical protein